MEFLSLSPMLRNQSESRETRSFSLGFIVVFTLLLSYGGGRLLTVAHLERFILLVVESVRWEPNCILSYFCNQATVHYYLCMQIFIFMCFRSNGKDLFSIERL